MAITTRPAPTPAFTRPVWYSRPAAAGAALTAVLVVLMLLTDPMGFLSTDVGGKLATLEAMGRNGGLSPDLGYWAESADPDGSLYPMFSTKHVGDTWVNVTTLPMLVLAAPLYALGGATAVGLIPVLGTVLAAFGARALARRLDSDGTVAFWIVGVASPATIYALDFWEHSLGLALIVWAVVAALDASSGDRGVLAALLAGIGFGVAASMRQEALVYGFVAGGCVGVRMLVSGRVLGAALRGAAMALGLGAMVVLNSLLESELIGDATRAGRSTNAATRAGGDVGLRLEEAVMTLASPFARSQAVFLVLALLTLATVVELGRRANDDRTELRPIVIMGAALGALALVDLLSGGLGFIPGMAATTPVAALALTQGWANSNRRFVMVIALGSLPLVWAVQYTGGAGPQWGGRYILTTGTLLVVIATVVFSSDRARSVLRATALVGFVVTLVGVAWTVQRTHSFADAMQTVADRSEPAVVFHDPHLAREAGPLVLDEQWLAATGEDGRAEAAVVLDSLGIDEIAFVEHDLGNDPRVLPGWEVVRQDRVPLVSGLHLLVTTQHPAG